VYANPPTWGLANAPARTVTRHMSILDFSWAAIPPLVDLRRVVLPVARTGMPYPGKYAER
jgi:hypothetical protein